MIEDYFTTGNNRVQGKRCQSHNHHHLNAKEQALNLCQLIQQIARIGGKCNPPDSSQPLQNNENDNAALENVDEEDKGFAAAGVGAEGGDKTNTKENTGMD